MGKILGYILLIGAIGYVLYALLCLLFLIVAFILGISN
jgi:hypothetical protein